MSESLVVCEVDDDLVQRVKEFRFRKSHSNAAIVMKIDTDNHRVVLEHEFDGISPEELQEELPERQPRFIIYTFEYKHDDGRISYPLCFIFSSPAGCRPLHQMMYAGSKNKLVSTIQMSKVFEIRSVEELTEEWLKDKIGFFR